MTDSDYQSNLALYEKLINEFPEVERKGATMPYTSLNGNMFSFLMKEGKLALRLSKEERDAFLEKFETEPCIQYGTVMKEYVTVPDTLLQNTEELKKYFKLSFLYASSLKPKAGKKKPRNEFCK